MSNSDTPWEPPIAGTEAEQLLGALERQRATFRWKTDDLGRLVADEISRQLPEAGAFTWTTRAVPV